MRSKQFAVNSIKQIIDIKYQFLYNGADVQFKLNTFTCQNVLEKNRQIKSYVINDLAFIYQIGLTSLQYQIMSSLKRMYTAKPQNPIIIDLDSDSIEPQLHKINKTGSSSIKNPYEFIEEVPQIALNMYQMNSDPIKLICELETKYAEYGAVKLTACDEWKYTYNFPNDSSPVNVRKQILQDLTLGKPFEERVKCVTIPQYKKNALMFSQNYKYVTSPTGTTPQAIIEHEYWNLVTNQLYSKNRISVTYAADLPSSRHGSGFPTATLENEDADCHFNYSNNLFNLNNIYKSPYSLLRMIDQKKDQISGISQPWMYVGMLFATFCWHVQDLFLNSLNYNHQGQTKTWYVVPGKDKQLFDNYVKENYQSNGKRNLLEQITLTIDPLELIKAGIKVYKVHQRPKDYVLTFFKAYHAGFSHGYNVCEAANFISYESIDSIKQAFRYYQQQELLYNKKMKAQVLSFDWVIYQTVVQNLPIPPEYRKKVMKEYNKILNREYILLKSNIDRYGPFHNVNIIDRSKKYWSNKCTYCKNYTYLSSIKCLNCSQNLCEWHVNKCECTTKKWTLVIRELNTDRQNLVTIVPMLNIQIID